MGNKIAEYGTKVLLVALAVVALYWLYDIIRDPIMAKRHRQMREKKVIQRLEAAREAQKTFKDMYGRYTGSWDSLMHMIKYDTMPIISTKGDPNDTTQKIIRDTTFVPVKQTVFKNRSVPVDSIQYAPFTGKRFKMDAGRIKLRGVYVHVFEIKDVKPINKKTLKVGSMEKGITSGNW